MSNLLPAVRAFKRAWAPIDKGLDVAENAAAQVDGGEWSALSCANIRQREFERLIGVVADRFHVPPKELYAELANNSQHEFNKWLEAQ